MNVIRIHTDKGKFILLTDQKHYFQAKFSKFATLNKY